MYMLSVNLENSPLNSALIIKILFHKYKQIVSYDRAKLKNYEIFM